MSIRAVSVFLLATALGLAPLAAASATTAALATDAPKTTWGVVPANATGPDTRFSFAYAVDQGRLIQDQVAITNTGTQTTTFKLYAADALTDFQTGAFGLQPATAKPTGLATWIHLSVDSITVPAGQAVVVPFQVAVPTNAPPGDHAAGIIASITTKTTDSKGVGINLEQRVGAAVYTRVSGDVGASVKITGLVDSYAGSWNPFANSTASVDYQVKNTGNVRMDIAQDLTLKGPFGIPLAHITNLKPVLNILPGDTTHTHIDIPDIPAVFLLFADVTLTPGPPTDSLAKSAEQNYDGTPAVARPPLDYHPVTGETLTGAVPWILLLIILAIAAGIWSLVRYIRASQLRMYDAIDAAAEEAREAALVEAGAGRDRDSNS